MVLVIVFITLPHIGSFAIVALKTLGDVISKGILTDFAKKNPSHKPVWVYYSYKSLSVDNIIKLHTFGKKNFQNK